MAAQVEFEVDNPPKKTIKCTKFAKSTQTLDETPDLIFTHGAGGTIKTDAVIDFINGFIRHASPVLCFQGNMNLNSRVQMFQAVQQEQDSARTLGGRSMGARAAIMATGDHTSHLVLVSYPLQAAGKATRDQILLDIPKNIKVIFISGDRDSMCAIDALDDVRSRMACQTWLCVVHGADHGMKMTPKARSKKVVEKTGELAALWLQKPDDLAFRTDLVWNSDTDMPETAAGSVSVTKHKRAHSQTPESESKEVKRSRRKQRK